MRRAVKGSVGLTVVATIAASGVAWATWTATGMGTGNARAGEAIAVDILDVAATGASLHPGGTGNLTIRIGNPNAFPVGIHRVFLRPSVAITADAAHQADGCHTTGVVFPATPSRSSVHWSLAAGQAATFTIAAGVRMTNASDNACQGATFTIPVEVIAASDA